MPLADVRLGFEYNKRPAEHQKKSSWNDNEIKKFTPDDTEPIGEPKEIAEQDALDNWAVAVMVAAVINGLIGPVLTRKILEADEPTQKLLHLILLNNYLLNQGLTKVYVAATAFAVMAWSVYLWSKGKLMKAAAVIGFIVGI